MGCDGNLMPVYTSKVLYPRAVLEQLLKHEDKRVSLHTYIKSNTMQLRVCSVTIRHKNSDKPV